MSKFKDWKKKLLRTLRAVLLSMHAMDDQVELQEMKVSKFKLAFIVLLIATTVWGIVFYYVLQEYHKFVEGLNPLARKWGLWDPWWRWNGMPYIIIAGICLLCAWVLLIGNYLSSKSK